MILRSTDDVLNRFADAGLRLFDRAIRDDYGDIELHEEFKKMAKVYFSELFMNATDEVMNHHDEAMKP